MSPNSDVPDLNLCNESSSCCNRASPARASANDSRSWSINRSTLSSASACRRASNQSLISTTPSANVPVMTGADSSTHGGTPMLLADDATMIGAANTAGASGDKNT